MAIRIFLHAWRMIFQNVDAAVKVSLPIIILYLLGFLLIGVQMSGAASGNYGFNEISVLRIVLFALAYLVAVVWTAVAWHRYCLLAEHPAAILPPFNPDRMLAYFGYAVVIALLFMLVGVVAFGLAFGVFGGSFITIVVAFAGVIALMILFHRVGIVLPGAAIGESLGLARAWAITKSLNGVIVGVVFILFGFAIGLSLLVFIAESIHPMFGVLVNVFASWLQMLVSLSILTTLYGIAVQGRDID